MQGNNRDYDYERLLQKIAIVMRLRLIVTALGGNPEVVRWIQVDTPVIFPKLTFWGLIQFFML